MAFGNDISIIKADPCSCLHTWWTGTLEPERLNKGWLPVHSLPALGSSGVSQLSASVSSAAEKGQVLGHWAAGAPEFIGPAFKAALCV